MSALLERIAAHSQPGAVRRIEVPEWGDENGPLVITYKTLTLEELEAARKMAPDNPLRQQCELVCMKALDANGKPLFRRIDAVELMKTAAPEVILRVGDEIGRRISQDEAEKN